MVHWYRHDIPAWRGGTASLTADQYRVYHVICEQIYLEEGPITVHEKALAGQANMSIRLVRSTLSQLVEIGKLQVVFEGKIDNFRTRTELEQVASNRRNAGKGGRTSGETRRKCKENNSDDEATLQDTRSAGLTEKTIEEKTITSSLRKELVREHPHPHEKLKPKNRGTRLPEDWQPTEEGMAFALEVLGAGRVHGELAKFRDYWLAKAGQGAVKTDWGRTWNNWCRNTAERQGQNGFHFLPRPGSKEDQRERTADALRKLDQFVKSHADDGSGSRGTGAADARLLPFGKSA